MNLSQAIIKKSLKRVDYDCVSFGVLDSIGIAAKAAAQPAVLPRHEREAAVICICNNRFFAKFSWPGDNKEISQSSSKAAAICSSGSTYGGVFALYFSYC